MTDRERQLLELAAKAAGVEHEGFDEDEGRDVWWIPDLARYDSWNPLADDGDALRLLVRLRLTVNLTECRCCAGVYACQLDGDGDCPDVSVRHSSEFDDAETTDPYAATRLAIVRAAAEIGKSMEGKQ